MMLESRDELLADLVGSKEWSAYKNWVTTSFMNSLEARLLTPASNFPEDLWKKEQAASALKYLIEATEGLERGVKRYLEGKRLDK